MKKSLSFVLTGLLCGALALPPAGVAATRDPATQKYTFTLKQVLSLMHSLNVKCKTVFTTSKNAHGDTVYSVSLNCSNLQSN